MNLFTDMRFAFKRGGNFIILDYSLMKMSVRSNAVRLTIPIISVVQRRIAAKPIKSIYTNFWVFTPTTTTIPYDSMCLFPKNISLLSLLHVRCVATDNANTQATEVRVYIASWMYIVQHLYVICVCTAFFVCVCLDGFINVDCSVLTSIHITYVYTNTRQYLMFGVPLSLLLTRFYLYIRVCVSERFFCPNAARNQASFPFRKYWEEHISLLTVDSGIKIEQKQILYDFIV